jgi:hypothetical protein
MPFAPIDFSTWVYRSSWTNRRAVNWRGAVHVVADPSGTQEPLFFGTNLCTSGTFVFICDDSGKCWMVLNTERCGRTTFLDGTSGLALHKLRFCVGDPANPRNISFHDCPGYATFHSDAASSTSGLYTLLGVSSTLTNELPAPAANTTASRKPEKNCYHCNGTKERTCDSCFGSGEKVSVSYVKASISYRCSRCNGSGHITCSC